MFVILVLYLVAVCYCQVPADEDVYVLNFNSPVYVCPDEKSQAFVDTSGVEVQIYNETTSYMTGIINFLTGIKQFTLVELLVDREISGQYEMIISHEMCDLCKEIGNKESIYYKYLKFFGFPDKCPFEAGTYTVSDFVPDPSDLPVNAVTSGRYQVTINMFENPDGSCKNVKNFIGCLKLDFIIEPL